MAEQFDPFGSYRNDRKAARIKHIQSALAILSNATYANVTNLAIDAAKIISEFEYREFLLMPAAVQAKGFKPVSHVTLLRNADYRPILDQMVKDEEAAEVVTIVSNSDFEALKIRNASLNGQIEQLKLTIRNFDAGIVPTTSEEADVLREEIDKLRESLVLMFSIYDGMQSEGKGIYLTVLPGDEGEDGFYNAPGLWGVMNQIATHEQMVKVNKLREELKRLRRQ